MSDLKTKLKNIAPFYDLYLFFLTKKFTCIGKEKKNFLKNSEILNWYLISVPIKETKLFCLIG